jgi:hypothetical protein
MNLRIRSLFNYGQVRSSLLLFLPPLTRDIAQESFLSTLGALCALLGSQLTAYYLGQNSDLKADDVEFSYDEIDDQKFPTSLRGLSKELKDIYCSIVRFLFSSLAQRLIVFQRFVVIFLTGLC